MLLIIKTMNLIEYCKDNPAQLVMELFKDDNIGTHINDVDKFGQSILMWAIIRNQTPVALKLLEFPNINYNHISQDDQTALIWHVIIRWIQLP